ncbi:S-layer homology domain-containing protein [Paenibacillus glycanilyticus]|uniref:S-layer homology domain-containing protein n=1 Tax=Paenibacillus glycanilyticus TaxID=126569 RepID=UPI00203D041E|nr:S-layer homology domain-containing protein [Paenibacillus glycanilyticus]MCM3628265.1 S-layer homology domain-containing protein [Paenibacillus glycanilyticus]
MTSKFKLVTLAATAVLTLSIAGQSFAATSTTFTDIANVSAKDKIISLQNKGLVQGVSQDRYLPDATLTAAQGIQLIVNALDLNIDTLRFIKEPHATDYFPKADNDAWYADALIIAANNDIGLPNDLDPNKVWTKEEFTHQLILAIEKHSNLPLIKIIPVEFNDEAELTDAYQGSVQRALVLKIAELDEAGNFNPTDEITRADAAVLIYNALAYIDAAPAPSAE